MAERSKAADCKSVVQALRRFKSCLTHGLGRVRKQNTIGRRRVVIKKLQCLRSYMPRAYMYFIYARFVYNYKQTQQSNVNNGEFLYSVIYSVDACVHARMHTMSQMSLQKNTKLLYETMKVNVRG